MACWSLIDFEPTEMPGWRTSKKENSTPVISTLKTSVMLQQIVKFQAKYMTTNVNHQCSFEELVRFVQIICKEEHVGTYENENKTKDIISKVMAADNNPIRLTSRKEVETANVAKAVLTLQNRVNEEKDDCKGLLEIDECILGIHRILLTGLDDQLMTPAGKFSQFLRSAEYNGEVHFYPRFGSQEEARDAVQLCLDRYNELFSEISKQKKQNLHLFVSQIFKLSSYLLFTLISLHPFGDGNGRLCRLLANYCLSTMTPFPSPIYNVYTPSMHEDFLNSIITCRNSNDKKPRDLCALIIEANYASWLDYIKTNKVLT
ncbi:uncharacterized protein LOC111632694 [Centruroides sculpturatus]|uniref:uncharacterized protein LOC111632694 n=1 Tax=Centruroides sculpturatus TaxID=218467 RepID=UPI000C6EC465|nr:uncharacterized protein LOC111632694 [Centruroides sculpturatus]